MAKRRFDLGCLWRNPVLRACAIALMVAAGFVFDTAVAFVMLLALPPEPLLSAL